MVRKAFKFHPYLLNVVLPRRNFSKQMCIRVLENAVKKTRQEDGRYR